MLAACSSIASITAALENPRSKKASIDAGFRSRDRDGSDSLGVEGSRADPADDCVAKALVSHILETSQKESGTDPFVSGVRINARRSEEIRTRRVMTGEAQQAPLPNRHEAGDGSAPKRNVGFAGPRLTECVPHPIEHLVLFRRQRASDRYTASGQPAQGVTRIWKIIQADQHIHWAELRSLIQCPSSDVSYRLAGRSFYEFQDRRHQPQTTLN